MSPETRKQNTVDMKDLKRLAHGARKRSTPPNLLNLSIPSFSPPPLQSSLSAKALGLTPEEADQLRDEGKCFKCRNPGHSARDCDDVAENVPNSWDTEVVVDLPDVAKPFYLRDLDTNAFVTLRVGKDAVPFVVPKAILCMRSDYFRAMFEGKFIESQSRTTDLPDIEPKYFALVLRWFHTGLVMFSDKSDFVCAEDDETFNEAIQMFRFADQYDTRDLRLAIFDVFAYSKARPEGSLDSIPVANALAQLPESSGLYKFFEDLIIYNWDPRDLEQCTEIALCLPPTVMGKLLLRGLSPISCRSEKAPYDKDMCQYHEHLSETERNQCPQKMKDKMDKLRNKVLAQEKLNRVSLRPRGLAESLVHTNR
ncbi:hypothetical protein E6O75_ATG09623 [Venturia nashicola]|uniref:CCHC-type domain-containing protein n=1 Tax=Venturia nashicola TaxID=86259 RepID=A0A4Z1NZW4_9PEZI|nr:hypothetical protein E6O75_ATG09623 [Venturia nashicola]